MSLLNYTTSITAERTISEIQQMLVKHGVTGMITRYDGPNVSSMTFGIKMGDREFGFQLPCNWRAVKAIFKDDPKIRNTKYNSDEQAIKTAWRIIHVWIKAQLALVDVNMTTIPQIFLPYAVGHDGRTLSERVSENPNLILGESKAT